MRLNPAAFDCSMGEDSVGKVARHSRRISFKFVKKNVFQAWQAKDKSTIDKFNKSVRERASRALTPMNEHECWGCRISGGSF